jgi:hypothetical protein
VFGVAALITSRRRRQARTAPRAARRGEAKPGVRRVRAGGE